MAILYEIKERKNPQQPGDPGKFYPNVVRVNTLSTNELVKEIEKESTMSKADILGVLIATAGVVGRQLRNSNAIRLFDLGIISVSLGGPGADTIDQFNTKEHITKVKVQFLADKILKKELEDVEFKKVEIEIL